MDVVGLNFHGSFDILQKVCYVLWLLGFTGLKIPLLPPNW
jgi:hypothetical protein